MLNGWTRTEAEEGDWKLGRRSRGRKAWTAAKAPEAGGLQGHLVHVGPGAPRGRSHSTSPALARHPCARCSFCLDSPLPPPCRPPRSLWRLLGPSHSCAVSSVTTPLAALRPRATPSLPLSVTYSRTRWSVVSFCPRAGMSAPRGPRCLLRFLSTMSPALRTRLAHSRRSAVPVSRGKWQHRLNTLTWCP